MADIYTVQLNPGPDVCDGYWHEENGRWTNTAINPIYVKGIHLWQGASMGLMVDLLGALYLNDSVVNTSRLIMVASWDRYNPTDGSRTTSFTFTPDALCVEPNQWFLLARRGASQNNSTPNQCLMTVWFWYTCTR